MINIGVLRAILRLKDELSPGLKRASDGLAAQGVRVAKAAALLASSSAVAFGLFASRAADAASRAEETQNLFEVAFGDMADEAEEWAQRTEAAVGINATTLKEYSGTLQSILIPMGLAEDQAFELSAGFTQLAFDLSSLRNVPFERAFQAIQSGLVGQSEPLRALGISVLDNTIKQTEFAKAIIATGRELTEAEKVQARSIAILQQSEIAQGDMIRTADSWANQTRLVGESWTRLLEEVGGFITNSPVISGLIGVINDALKDGADVLKDNKEAWQALIDEGLSRIVTVAANALDSISELGVGLEKIGNLFTFDVRQALGMEPLPGGPAFEGAGKDLEELGQFLQDAGDKARGFKEELLGVRTTGATDEIDALSSGYQTVSENAGPATEQIKKNAEASAAAAGFQAQYARSVEAAKEAMAGAAVPTEEYTKQLTKLEDTLTGAKLAEQAAIATAALADIGGDATITGMQSLSGLIDDLRTNSTELSPELRQVALELDKIALNQGLLQVLSQVEPLTISTMEWKEALQEVVGTVDVIGPAIDAALGPNGQAIVGGITDRTVDLDTAMGEVNDILSETRGIMNILGVDSESTAGKIIEGFSRVFDTFNSVLGIVSKLTGLLGSGGGLLSGLGSLFGGGGGGGAGIGGLVGGGLSLGTLGIGGLIGAGVFGVSKLIGSLFGGRGPGGCPGRDSARNGRRHLRGARGRHRGDRQEQPALSPADLRRGRARGRPARRGDRRHLLGAGAGRHQSR